MTRPVHVIIESESSSQQLRGPTQVWPMRHHYHSGSSTRRAFHSEAIWTRTSQVHFLQHVSGALCLSISEGTSAGATIQAQCPNCGATNQARLKKKVQYDRTASVIFLNDFYDFSLCSLLFHCGLSVTYSSSVRAITTHACTFSLTVPVMTMELRRCMTLDDSSVEKQLVIEQDKLRAPTAAEMGFDQEPFRLGTLSIVVLGATGDLAKKETFPALLDLVAHEYLPSHVAIVGVGRTKQDTKSFREWLESWLVKSFAGQMKRCKDAIPSFLKKVTYFSANYDSKEDFARLALALETEETQMLLCL